MSVRELSGADEEALLERAQSGDEAAYEQIVGVHRAELHAHCYRMLASVHDADDAVQEALIRAWRGLAQFESRSSLRTWLYRIATNTSFDVLKKRKRRRLAVDYGRRAGPGESPGELLLDAPWLEPYPDAMLEDARLSPEARYEARESLELAFVAAIQYVPPRQRAVLILREVLDFSAIDVSELLDMSVAAVNSSLQRARASLVDRLPVTSQQRELQRLGVERVDDLARRYANAIDNGDIESLVAMLTDDATWSMPPHRRWYQGRAAIAEFHADSVSGERWRHLATRANGQLAIGCYTFDDARGCFVGSVLDILTLRDGQIASVSAFIAPELLRRSGLDIDQDGGLVDFLRFGLPLELAE
jgi:RNA polymerase sigma-70 factor (ECF subfamily)